MAGHSHAANVAVRKGKQDAKRAQAFSKMSKLLMVAARGGPDLAANFTLRHIVDKAKAISMPKDKIDHAIKKGAGLLADGGDQLQEVLYEGYGPGGSAIMVECLTDNLNRTVPNVRNIFERAGGKMGNSGCVAYQFKRMGLFAFDAGDKAEDEIFMTVVDAGAENLEKIGKARYEVLCAIDRFQAVDEAIQELGIEPEIAELSYICDQQQSIDRETGEKVVQLIENLQADDDVNQVYVNVDLSEVVQ